MKRKERARGSLAGTPQGFLPMQALLAGQAYHIHRDSKAGMAACATALQTALVIGTYRPKPVLGLCIALNPKKQLYFN
jgi:hypothetical protein